MSIELNLKGLEFAASEFVASGFRQSPEYQVMDTALPALAAMRRKGAKYKDLAEVLRANGMPNVTLQQVTSYFNTKATKAKVEKLNKDFESAREKQQRLNVDAKQQQKLKGNNAPKSSIASAVIKSTEVSELGLLVPWQTFVGTCKVEHNVGLADIREALEDFGMVTEGGKKFTRSNPYFQNVKDWAQPIKWKEMSVYMGLASHLFGD